MVTPFCFPPLHLVVSLCCCASILFSLQLSCVHGMPCPCMGRDPRASDTSKRVASGCHPVRYQLAHDDDSTATCEDGQPKQFHGCPGRTRDLRPVSAVRGEVPCGFLRPSRGYERVRHHFLRRFDCHLVVYTVIFGHYDYLRNPSGVNLTAEATKGVCFVALLDTHAANSSVLLQPFNQTIWEIWVVDDLPYPGQQHRSSLVGKMLPQRLFPHAHFSIYVDGKVELICSPWVMLNDLLRIGVAPPERIADDPCEAAARSRNAVAVWRQSMWDSSFGEFRAELTRLRHNRTAIKEQLRRYREEQPEFFGVRLRPADTAVLVQQHRCSCLDLWRCAWMNEVMEYRHSREQLSLPYVIHRLGLQDALHYYRGSAKYFQILPHRYQYRVLRIWRLMPAGHRIPVNGAAFRPNLWPLRSEAWVGHLARLGAGGKKGG